MGLNPKVWMPYLWFVLYTIAIEYPKNPNDFTKKKYYTLIQNLPVYFPSKPIGTRFAKLLDNKIFLESELFSNDGSKKFIAKGF